MNEPDWARVLSYFYENQEMTLYLYDLPESHEIVEYTDINPQDIKELLENLESLGLLNRKDVDTTHYTENGRSETESEKYIISKKGFEVAHEREQSNISQATNRDIRNLTLILALTASIQALAAAFTVSVQYQFLIIFFVIIVLIIISRSNFV